METLACAASFFGEHAPFSRGKKMHTGIKIRAVLGLIISISLFE
jgi:hypothetical protein